MIAEEKEMKSVFELLELRIAQAHNHYQVRGLEALKELLGGYACFEQKLDDAQRIVWELLQESNKAKGTP